uniref:hypothetical protein n=1 Tax=Staphylococcus aureus TaxID=1280 RepID=UPI0038B2D191
IWKRAFAKTLRSVHGPAQGAIGSNVAKIYLHDLGIYQAATEKSVFFYSVNLIVNDLLLTIGVDL